MASMLKKTRLPFRTGSQATRSDDVGTPTNPTGVTTQVQYDEQTRQFKLDFLLDGATIPVTDAAGSGSSGSLQLFDFAANGILIKGSRVDYTKFAEGSALTGAAGDAAFVMALGSAAANAGDGTLTGTEIDISGATSTITLSSGTSTFTQVYSTAAAINGTATPTDIFLNWSGSAATIDANSNIRVWGSITVAGELLGDD